MALSCSKVSIFSPSPIMGHGTKNLTFSSSSLNLSKEGDRKKDLKVFAASANAPTTLTGVIFEPFEEVKKEILAVPIAHNVLWLVRIIKMNLNLLSMNRLMWNTMFPMCTTLCLHTLTETT
jgi:hypothetical protein